MTAVPPGGGAMNADERQWSMLSWIGVIILGFIGPLIVMLTKGNESPAIKANATEALNFSIQMAIWYAVAFLIALVTCGIGGVLIFIPMGLSIAFGIIGAMKTNQGEMYQCPVNFFRLVK